MPSRRRPAALRTRTAAHLVLLGALLCACSATPADAPGTPPAPSDAAAATSSPPTVAAVDTGIQETSDPDLGIVFEDVPDLTGAEADVYDVVAAYQKEYWRMMTTNALSPAFSVLASPDITARLQDVADQNARLEAEIGETFRTTISDVTVDATSATATVCDDFGNVTAADPHGTYSPTEVGLDNIVKHLTLAPSATGGWQVVVGDSTGTC